ncbi:hypothetical protein FEK43_18620 [Escherichia sp. E2562]|uniref:hypothetical protein n=1 Tax=unclassified Escherichia TaxID=2608889 RepID=UPI00102A43EB|nr:MULTISPECIES: hypothetical protein [unclassified Escherichia]TLI79672.1 hypothetical protein FEK43_18620 [Escherichia sp. E2562]
MGYLWDNRQIVRARAKYGVSDFTPLSQDKCCVLILILKVKRKGSLEMIAKGDINGALDILSYEWASLPPGRFGQPAKTRGEADYLFEKYLKEELKGNTVLYLPVGYISKFLKVE